MNMCNGSKSIKTGKKHVSLRKVASFCVVGKVKDLIQI